MAGGEWGRGVRYLAVPGGDNDEAAHGEAQGALHGADVAQPALGENQKVVGAVEGVDEGLVGSLGGVSIIEKDHSLPHAGAQLLRGIRNLQSQRSPARMQTAEERLFRGLILFL